MSEDINLTEIARSIRARYRAVLTLTGVGTLAAVFISLVMTPVYRAETVLMPVENGSASGLAQLAGQFGGLASIAGVPNLAEEANPQEALALLQSRNFIFQFIEERNLLPTLFASDWDPQTNDWQSQSAEETPTLWDAYELFDEEILTITEDSRTGIITVAIDWKDPHVAADWANTLIYRLNEQMRSRAIRDAESSLDFLNQQLETVKTLGVRQSIFHLVENQIKLTMLAKVREEYALKVIDSAVPPDLDDPVAPEPILYTVIGMLIGLMFGLAYAVVRAHSPVEQAPRPTVAAAKDPLPQA